MRRLASRVGVTALLSQQAAVLPVASWAPRRWCAEKAETEKPKEDAAAEKTPEKKKPEEANKAEDKKEAPKGNKEVEQLKKDIEKKDAEIKELKNKVLYTAAEAENARRIGREDTAKARDFAVQGFGKDMLEVADTLDRAVEAFSKLSKEELDANPKINGIHTGVKMCNSVLLGNFAKHGIEKMAVEVGSEFDPNEHDALFNTPATDKVKAGHIATIVKTGYTLKSRVLRAAQVGVAEKSE